MMLTATGQTTVAFVNSTSELRSLINSVANLPFNPPSLYLDLEGIKLGRLGSLSIISVEYDWLRLLCFLTP